MLIRLLKILHIFCTDVDDITDVDIIDQYIANIIKIQLL